MEKQHKWQHLLWWSGLYIFWLMVFQKRAFAFSQTLTVQFCYLVFIAANFYFNIYFTIPKFLYRKKYVAFAVAMLAGILVTACLRVPLAMYLNKYYFLPDKPQPEARELLSSSFLNIFIWVVCIISGKLIADRFRFQQYVDLVEKARSKAELDFLNAQFNPHFLFNSINSIYGHIEKHNATARHMLLTFSEMLRYQLYECNTDAIPIDKEIGYLRNYVAMQQTRKEDNLVVEMFVDEQVRGFSITPLLFIAFIENAFKYVSNVEEKESRVVISFQRTADELFFKCFNTRDASQPNGIRDKGIGISNARRRMALLYPDRHDLWIAEEDDHYEVFLKIRLS